MHPYTSTRTSDHFFPLPRLDHSTKHLIEDYTDEVVSQLEYIARTQFEGFTEQARLEFFNDTRQSFGNTALLLHGGATFGMNTCVCCCRSLVNGHWLSVSRICTGRLASAADTA